jgi:hypothetical protein
MTPLSNLSKKSMSVMADRLQNLLLVRRWHAEEEACLIFHFCDKPAAIRVLLPDGEWCKHFDSGEKRWGGPGSGVSGRLQASGPLVLTLAPWSAVGLSGSRRRQG